MAKINTQNLFEELNSNYSKYKVERLLDKGGISKKEHNRKNFLDRVKESRENIWFFGIKYPNYFTTRENKISKTLRELDKKRNYINVHFFVPSDSILSEINKLKIYKDEVNGFKTNLEQIMKIENYKYLKIQVYEYDKFYYFGASAIDLLTENEFIHVSQVKEREYIEEAAYFEFENNESETEEIRKKIKEKFRSIQKSSTVLIKNY